MAVVRNVFPRSQAEAWDEGIGDYLARNDYVSKAATRDAGDRYFTSLKSSRPQIRRRCPPRLPRRLLRPINLRLPKANSRRTLRASQKRNLRPRSLHQSSP